MYRFTLQLLDMWIDSRFGLLRIKPLWTLLHFSFGGISAHFCWVYFLGCRMQTLSFGRYCQQFSRGDAPFDTLSNTKEHSSGSTSSDQLLAFQPFHLSSSAVGVVVPTCGFNFALRPNRFKYDLFYRKFQRPRKFVRSTSRWQWHRDTSFDFNKKVRGKYSDERIFQSTEVSHCKQHYLTAFQIIICCEVLWRARNLNSSLLQTHLNVPAVWRNPETKKAGAISASDSKAPNGSVLSYCLLYPFILVGCEGRRLNLAKIFWTESKSIHSTLILSECPLILD